MRNAARGRASVPGNGHDAISFTETSPLTSPPVTPDGRYIVVRGRLWRRANPALPDAERQALVRRLMAARRGVAQARKADDAAALAAARAEVDATKIALGERGRVWWADGAPDLNRHMARTTSYRDWFASIDPEHGS